MRDCDERISRSSVSIWLIQGQKSYELESAGNLNCNFKCRPNGLSFNLQEGLLKGHGQSHVGPIRIGLHCKCELQPTTVILDTVPNFVTRDREQLVTYDLRNSDNSNEFDQSDNSRSFTYFTSFYRAMLCIGGTSHGPVSVCLCLSQAGVLLKRQNVGSHKQHHTIPGSLVF